MQSFVCSVLRAILPVRLNDFSEPIPLRRLSLGSISPFLGICFSCGPVYFLCVLSLSHLSLWSWGSRFHACFLFFFFFSSQNIIEATEGWYSHLAFLKPVEICSAFWGHRSEMRSKMLLPHGMYRRCSNWNERGKAQMNVFLNSSRGHCVFQRVSGVSLVWALVIKVGSWAVADKASFR